MKQVIKILIVPAVMLVAGSALGAQGQDKKHSNSKADLYQAVSDSERVYNVRSDRLWEVAVHAAYRGFRVDSTDADKAIIQMHTNTSLGSNGIHLTVTLEKDGPDKTRVKVKAEKKSGVFFWSSPGRVVRNYFKDIDSQLTEKN